MSKQNQSRAPESPKAPSAAEKPPEQPAAKPEASAVTDGAPESPKAPSVDGAGSTDGGGTGSISELERHDDDKPPCPKCTNERPCSVKCFVAAGYPAETYAARFGAAPDPAPAEEPEGPPKFVAPEGKAHCKAISTCGVRGMPAFAGEEFWYEWHEAEYLESVGVLEILNKS